MENLLRCTVTADALRQLRKDLRRKSSACGLNGRQLDGFVLAVNEIAANAIVHGGGSGLVTLWKAHEKLICEVVNKGNGIPPEATAGAGADLLAPGGRGLGLAGAMNFSIETSRGPGPAVVRVIARLPPRG
jgi:anti-sigma regulatory factor (Ser/Thr protein kinase)